jgi:hypothetical protein
LPSEILVAGLPAIAVMPVMKLRRSEQPTQRSKSDADVGVNENRLPVVEEGIRADRPFGKSQCNNRDQRNPLSEYLINGMYARSCQPV